MKEGEQSEMIRSLNKLVKVVGILIIPIGLLLFGQQFFVSHEAFRESITSMVAAVLGMIPEGLYLLGERCPCRQRYASGFAEGSRA